MFLAKNSAGPGLGTQVCLCEPLPRPCTPLPLQVSPLSTRYPSFSSPLCFPRGLASSLSGFRKVPQSCELRRKSVYALVEIMERNRRKSTPSNKNPQNLQRYLHCHLGMTVRCCKAPTIPSHEEHIGFTQRQPLLTALTGAGHPAAVTSLFNSEAITDIR